MGPLADHWERHAEQWLAWTDPDHPDGFGEATWPAIASLLPPSRGLTLDLACGEGRATRALSALGYDVIGVDRAPTLVRAAVGRGTRAVIGDAAALPMPSSSCSLVVCSMGLLDFDDLGTAVGEVARALQPGGSFVATIVHPTISGVDINATRAAGSLVMAEPYLVERSTTDDVERDGVRMVFHSRHRPLSAYLNLMGSNGLAVTAMVEGGTGDFPWLLAWRAERLAS